MSISSSQVAVAVKRVDEKSGVQTFSHSTHWKSMTSPGLLAAESWRPTHACCVAARDRKGEFSSTTGGTVGYAWGMCTSRVRYGPELPSTAATCNWRGIGGECEHGRARWRGAVSLWKAHGTDSALVAIGRHVAL